MKKIICIFLLLSNYYCFSQNVVDSTNYKPFKPHTVYAELLGNAFYIYSIGYDYTLKIKEKHKLAFNCGLQYFTDDIVNNYMFSVSPQVSYLYGKTHHFEIGIGWTGFMQDITDVFETHWSIPLRIGYRYQKESGGFFFKAAFTPSYNTLFGMGTYYDRDVGDFTRYIMGLWAGVAFGYTFK